MTTFYYCECYFSRNIYIKEYSMHFTYSNLQQFYRDYSRVLSSLGCDSELKEILLVQRINEEVNRRKNQEKETLQRKELLQKFYKPSQSIVYILKDSFIDPWFKLLVTISKHFKKEEMLPFLDVISKEKQLYGFPVFTKEFCSLLLKELCHYIESDLPKERPNSMNRHGVLLDEIGFHEKFSRILRTEYLDPLAASLFPEWRGEGLDSHKIFSVGYKMGEDLDLAYHYDNSEVTLNICLGKSFEGSELYFGDFRTDPISDSTCISVPNKVGYGIFHRGQQLHGALSLTSGERYNLVVWLRSSSVRNKMCPMCNSKPKKLLPSHGYGEGFTNSEETIVEICSVI